MKKPLYSTPLYSKVIITFLNSEGVDDDVTVSVQGSIDYLTLEGWKYNSKGKELIATKKIRIKNY